MTVNISNPEVYATVDKVCQALCHKFSFGNFDPDDIYQESFLICVEKLLPKYDGDRPLENFLKVSLKNRLINFKREKTLYYKFTCSECNNSDDNCEYCAKYRLLYAAKKNLDSPVNIDEIKDEQLHYEHIEEECNMAEFYSLINRNLPLNMREDYLKMMSDVYVSKPRREEIIGRIKDILKQNDFLDEDGESNENGQTK